MHTSDPSGSVIPCLFAALRDIEGVTKTKTATVQRKDGSTGYEYTYATLSDTLYEVKRALGNHKLALLQNAETGPDGLIYLVTTVMHENGEWVRWNGVGMRLPADPQALGSTLTYLRRYTLTTIFALPVDDDDGQDATRQVRHAQENGGQRSEAEHKIRTMLGEMTPEKRAEVVAEFRERFKCGLSELPVIHHGEALTWLVQYVTAKAGPPVAGYDPDDPMGVGPGTRSGPTAHEAGQMAGAAQ
jgi:hypothetical protein